MCANEVAEEVGGGEFGGGVEDFEDEFVIFELGGFEKPVVEDAEDEGVQAVRGEGYGEEVKGSECREDRDEDLNGQLSPMQWEDGKYKPRWVSSQTRWIRVPLCRLCTVQRRKGNRDTITTQQ